MFFYPYDSKTIIDGIFRILDNFIDRGGDLLYVPTDSLDNVRKYIGGREAEPRLSKLGSKKFIATGSIIDVVKVPNAYEILKSDIESVEKGDYDSVSEYTSVHLMRPNKWKWDRVN